MKVWVAVGTACNFIYILRDKQVVRNPRRVAVCGRLPSGGEGLGWMCSQTNVTQQRWSLGIDTPAFGPRLSDVSTAHWKSKG